MAWHELTKSSETGQALRESGKGYYKHVEKFFKITVLPIGYWPTCRWRGSTVTQIKLGRHELPTKSS